MAIINETMARRYLSGRDPMGARVRWARGEPTDWMTVVGAVAHVRSYGLNQSEEPAIYSALFRRQAPSRVLRA